ncbi:MAG: PIN domain-containing protein [Spirochaetaceae bacterium]|nr:PIN domain-containing protein [Spirochaetaceae bacterium]
MYLDTHVVIWLYEKDEDRISRRVRELIENSDLLVSPMVLLELEYLFETGRIKTRAAEIYDYLHDTIQLDVCGKPFAAVARKSIGVKWTRDPFDRLITAQAAVDESPLLTKDDTIHTYYPEAVW